jgi:hypothetical protein
VTLELLPRANDTGMVETASPPVPNVSEASINLSVAEFRRKLADGITKQTQRRRRGPAQNHNQIGGFQRPLRNIRRMNGDKNCSMRL